MSAVVCLSVLFLSSTYVYADDRIEQFSDDTYDFYYNFYYGNRNGSLVPFTTLKNDFTYSNSAKYNFNGITPVNGQDSLRFIKKDNSKIFSKGSTITIQITDFYNIAGYDSNSFTTQYGAVNGMGLTLIDIHGETFYTKVTEGTVNTEGIYYVLEDLPFDVYGFYVLYSYPLVDFHLGIQPYFNTTLQPSRTVHFNGSYFSFIEEPYDKTDSFLGSIIELIKNLPSKIADAFTSLFDYLLEGLQALADYILDFFVYLFVPSEGFLDNAVYSMTTAFENGFGCIYQGCNYMFNFAETLITYDGTVRELEFPSTTIHLGEVDFTFGGYEVDIVPSGFEEIQFFVQTAVTAVCAFPFINALRKRLEEVLK